MNETEYDYPPCRHQKDNKEIRWTTPHTYFDNLDETDQFPEKYKIP